MAIAQRGSATTGSLSGTSVSANKPTGTVSGDVLIATVTCNNQDVTPPSGWTEFFDEVVTSDGLSIFRSQGFYKVAGGSEPSSYAFTIGSNNPLLLTITAWSGVSNSDVFDIDVSVAATTTQSEPYSTPTLSGTGATSGKVMYYRSCRQSHGSTPGPTPLTFSESTSGVSEISDHGFASPTGSITYTQGTFAADADYADTSSKTGLAITASTTETHNIVATWALKAASVPGTLTATLPLLTVAMTASWAHHGSLAASVPMPTVAMSGVYGNTEAVLDVDLPLPVVSVAGASLPVGTLDTVITPIVSLGTETRAFGDNVIQIDRESRYMFVREDELRLAGVDWLKRFSRGVLDANLPLLAVDMSGAEVRTDADAGYASVTVTVNDATVQIHRRAFAGLASVTAEAFGKRAAGRADVTVTVNNPTVRIGHRAYAGHAAVSCHN